MTQPAVKLSLVNPRKSGHQNWLFLDSRNVGLSSGMSYYHQAVLDTQGILHLSDWLYLEPTQGNYNFSAITTSLNYAQTFGKKLVVRVFYKNYPSNTTKLIPAYIVNDHITYGGVAGAGGLRNTSWGADYFVPRFDNVNVMNRFKAMFTAMAAEIKDHPALQGIGPDESAWSFGATWPVSGLTAAQIRTAHREICSHLKTEFPGKEIYPFYNDMDGSSNSEVLAEVAWSWEQGMCSGITDTKRLTDMADWPQQAITAYPADVKTLMCVDFMSTGNNDVTLTETYLENARTTANYGADITAWYVRGGASSVWWTAIKNAISVFG